MKAKWLKTALAACTLAALAAGCGSSGNNANSSGAGGSSGSKDSITILSIGDTTGPTKAVGIPHYQGLQAAVAYYNANGGIDGRKIVVHHMSDNGDAPTAVTDLVQYLSSNPAPTMVDAGNEAGDAAALIPVLAKKNLFAVALNDGNHQCATNSQSACPNEWTLADPSIDSQLPPAAWLKAHGIHKVGVLEEQIDFTESETPTVLQALKKDGISYSIATFPATALDLTPQVSQLKSSGAQAVYTEALVAPAGYALVARSKLGWNVPMLFDVAASSLDLTKLAPLADVKNQADVDIFYEMDPKNPQPGVQHLIQYGKQVGLSGAIPLDDPGAGWDEVVALDQAIKSAGGKTDVKSLNAAMLKISPTDPNRTFARKLCFNASDHENVCGAGNDFEIVPAGPIVNGQVHSL